MRRALTAEIDFDTDFLSLHAAHPDRYPYLLESADDSADIGAIDLLFACPQERITLDSAGRVHGNDTTTHDFLSALDVAWRGARHRASSSEWAFAGGWFLLLGYELAGQIEPGLSLSPSAELPVAVATRVPAALVRDRRLRRAAVVCEAGREDLFAQLCRDLDESFAAIEPAGACAPIRLSEPDPRDFIGAVERAQEYIRAGEIYQANLSRKWRGTLPEACCPASVYARLRQENPAPFAGLAVESDFAVISSSPERLVRVRDDRIDTRPIAGTRPRTSKRETARIEELLTNEKERAEHVMLIDLERNDLGRICRPGSVMVDEFMTVESYSHVHHIVSNVSGVLRADTSPGDVVRAVFPGGTITGCPKVRCMELIDKLETRPRGFYTGAMGYLDHRGDLDLNILIRSITTQGRQVSVATGSGIVADSVPALELDETRAKARGMLAALEGRHE